MSSSSSEDESRDPDDCPPAKKKKPMTTAGLRMPVPIKVALSTSVNLLEQQSSKLDLIQVGQKNGLALSELLALIMNSNARYAAK